ncbi:hypothetical protein [Flavobacterium chungangense]|uniref:Uncharacterized protein n=1 Tax=Flavobacterium chungangense TaxID=554283 RepID=A0A6V6YLU2_9FLAO|nr:hypothetical protein [Flavobacterium chungangense]CAD0000395.1 hypothetical protein FLACHUCJ7_00014 [Flavobacterium chungangense]
MNKQLIADLAPFIENYDKTKQPLGQVFRQNNTITITEKELFIEAFKAWKAYQASADGLELNLLISESNLLGIQQKLKSIFDNKVFDSLKKLLDITGLDAGSFSIGLNIEAELVFGFTATIGLAIGVGINKGVSSSEFISVELTEGIDEGVLLGVHFGLWSNAPADLGGFSLATEVELGFASEIATKIVYAKRGSNKTLGVTAEIGAREENGVNEQESYTIVLDSQYLEGFSRTYQPVKNNLLIIESIKCIHPKNDGGGNENEIYFTFKADETITPYRYPTYDYMSVKEGYTWNCGRSIWFDNTIEIKLYDDDGNGLNGSDEITKNPIKINISDFVSINSSKIYIIDYKDGLDHIEYEITTTLIASNVNHK